MPKSQQVIEKEKEVKDKLAALIASVEKDKQRPINFLKSEAEPDKGYPGEKQLRDTKIESKSRVSEEFIQAIVLGAALDSDTLKEARSGINGVSPDDYMVMNVLTTRFGPRDTAYEIALLDARKKALEAITQMDAGDDSQVKQYAGNFTKYLDGIGSGHRINSVNKEANTFKAIYKLYSKVNREGVFENIQVAPDTKKKITEKLYVSDMLDRSLEKREKLYNEFDNLTKEDKNTLIRDILTIGVLGKLSSENNSKKLEDYALNLGSDYTLGDKYATKIQPKMTKEQVEKEKKYGDIKTQLYTTIAITVASGIAGQVSDSNVTYQTTVINDSERRDEYIEKVQKMVTESEQYKELINTDDLGRIDEVLQGVCFGTTDMSFREKDKDGKVIPDGKINSGIDIDQLYFSEEDKKADHERMEGLEAKIEEKLDQRLDIIAGDVIDAALDEKYEKFYKNTVIETQLPKIKAAFDKLVQKNKLDPEMDMVYFEDGQYIKGEDGAQVYEAILKGNPFYLKSTSDNKYFKINSKQDSKGNYSLTSENIDNFKVSGKEFFTNLNFYKLNNDLAKGRAGVISRNDCEISAYADSYAKLLSEAYPKNDMPAEYDFVVGSLKAVSSDLKKQYNKELNPNNDPVSEDDYRMLMGGYSLLKQNIQACIDYNPYDPTLKELEGMVDRDLKLFKEIDLENTYESLPDAIRKKQTKELSGARENISNEKNLEIVTKELGRLKHNLVAVENSNKKPNSADNYYKDIIKEVDRYLKADLLTRNDLKNDVLKACKTFIIKTTGADERITTVKEVGRSFNSITKMPRSFIFEKQANSFYEERKKRMLKQPDSSLKKYFLDPKNEKKIKDAIANDEMCEKLASGGKSVISILAENPKTFDEIDKLISEENKKITTEIEERLKNQAKEKGLDGLKLYGIYDAAGNKLDGAGDVLNTEGKVFIQNKSGFVKAEYNEADKSFVFEELQTIPDAASGRDKKIEAANLSAVRSEYKSGYSASNIYNQLGSWLKYAENIAGEASKSESFKTLFDRATELNNSINKYFTPGKENVLGTEIDRYPDINAEQFENIKKTCQSVLEAAENYPDKNGLINELKEIVSPDAKIFDKLSFENGPMPLAEAAAHSKENSLDKQNRIVEKAKNIKSIKATIQNDYFNSVNSSVITDYIIKHDLVQKYSDGVVRKAEIKGEDKKTIGVYYTPDGKPMDQEQYSKMLIDNEAGIKEAIKSNYSAPNHNLENNCSVIPEARKRLLSTIVNDYVEPNEDSIIRNNKISGKMDGILNEKLADHKLEVEIASGTKLPTREISAIMRNDGSETSRKWNKDVVKLTRSNNPEEVKQGYRMILEDLQKIEPAKYDIRNIKDTLSKPGEIIDFMIKGAELKKIIGQSKKAGVDIYDQKYDKLRNNASIIETLATAWNAKIRMIANPLFSYIGHDQLKNITFDKADKIATDLQNNKLDILNIDETLEAARKKNPELDVEEMKEDYIDQMMKQVVSPFVLSDCSFWGKQIKDSGYNLIREGKTNEENIEESRKNIEIEDIIDPNDRKMNEFRKLLVGNKRHNLFGKEKANSEYYDNVIKAIDAYRDAKPIDRERKRLEICKACIIYNGKRGNSTERGKLISKIGNEVLGMQKGALYMRHQGMRQLAKNIVGCYTSFLDDMKSYNEDFAKAYKTITDPKNYDRILDQVARTKLCVEYRKNPNYELTPAIVEKTVEASVARALGIKADQPVEKNPQKELEALVAGAPQA